MTLMQALSLEGSRPGVRLPALLMFGVLLSILATGLYLRVAAIQDTVIQVPIRADAFQYYHYARNLDTWDVYSRTPSDTQAPEPDAFATPGFPWFASLLFASTPEASLNRVLVVQTLLQVAAFLLLSVMLLRRFGLAWSLLPLLLLWTFPHFVSINTYYLTESLFTTCIALLVAGSLHVSGRARGEFHLLLVLGLLTGLAGLVRPTLQYFPLLLFVVLVIWQRRITREQVLVLGVSLLPMLAWGIRNLVVVGAWSDPAIMIASVYHGSFPLFMYNGDPASFAIAYRFDPLAGQVNESMGAALRIIFDRVRENPETYVRWYLFGKQFFLWQWSIIAGQGDVFIYPAVESPYYDNAFARLTHAANAAVHPLWIGAAFVGLGRLIYRIVRNPASLPLYWVYSGALFLYGILIHMLVAPYPRYGIPFKLALIMMLLFIAREGREWWGARKQAAGPEGRRH